MLVVMAVIAILAGIILSVNGLVQKKAALSKADGEIRALAIGCEKYKTDFGSYPMSPETATQAPYNGATNKLDPRLNGNPNEDVYKTASLVLYRALSGDMDCNMSVNDADGKVNIDGTSISTTTPVKPTIYIQDFFIPGRLGVSSISKVLFLKDPFGNSYGYSTKGAAIDQRFQTELAKNAATDRSAMGTGGYNTTFDLWSTGGKTSLNTANIGKSNDDTNVWVKNW
jgi:type II secretory pathway pseudopilin PulG